MTVSAIHLNWLAVVIAILAYFALGGVWYLFVVRKAYVEALGCEQTKGLASLLGPLVCISITTITSALLLRYLGIASYTGAAGFGALIGLGYQTPMTVNIALNPLFPRPFLYSLINAPYFVGGSILVCLILVAMK